jgi:tRNA threonylcarbamoyladenosine biosynthesis protein TsaE
VPQGRTVDTHSEEQTVALGRLLGESARAGDVVCLAGGLGAGKTCFVKGMARGMDIVEPIPSPTFNLLLVHSGRLPLYHFDLYRLERPDQLEDIDFFETAEAGGGVTAIEWADRFPQDMPPDRLILEMERLGENDRRLTVFAAGPASSALGRAWLDAWDAIEGAGP